MTLTATFKKLLAPQELYVKSLIENQATLITDPEEIDDLFDLGSLTPLFDDDILSRFTFDDSVEEFLNQAVPEDTLMTVPAFSLNKNYPRFPQDKLDRVSIYHLDKNLLEDIKRLNWNLSPSFKTVFFNTDSDGVYATIIDDPTVYFKELTYEFDAYSKLK